MTASDETMMRDLMSTVDPPPTRIDLSELVRNGRRAARRRTRSAVAVVGVFAVLLAAFAAVTGLGATRGGDTGPPAVRPAPGCTVERLALPDGTRYGSVSAASPDGRYLAGFAAGDGTATPVRWEGPRPQPIRGIRAGIATGVNDSGVVVGRTLGADGRQTAWAYAGDTVAELPIPAGFDGAAAYSINKAGHVAGVLFGGGRTAAAVWYGATADARVVVLAAKGEAMAFGIADSGVVVGARNGGGPYRWDADGRGGPLAQPPGTAGGEALGVRGDWAYGQLDDADRPAPDLLGGVLRPAERRIAVRWNLRTGEATAVAAGRTGAISAGGLLVVNQSDGTATLVAPDGTRRTLPHLAGSGPSNANAFNTDGTLIAGDSARTPARWTCGTGAR
ncbi:hypothetical protein [Phytohabitans rumicis]|uniref:Uncharacterized protein n=1 Tax=Phytohabitans rumicis TaxID=1076125 RepID=A0A6V8LPZ9_9ACTN|nr:hypothetical protein [Phytohabitans rumicis]GFJ96326.1 hypothetical protein Prum_099680 [Phytohabitans rumicis]